MCISIGPLITITILLLSASCSHKADLSGLPEVCFERDVLPVYTNSCAIAGCHDGGGRESHRAFNNYNDIVNTVTPGNPGASSSYQAIISKWGENKMPPGQPISLENRIMIRVWIEQGARHTVCAITKAADDHSLSVKMDNQLK